MVSHSDSASIQYDPIYLLVAHPQPVVWADSAVCRWEDPEDYSAMGDEAYQGTGGEDRAQRNLRRFAEAHIVPVSPWKEGEKVETMGGGTVWWESKDGQKTVSS